MTIYMLEMRNTESWDDVRYRDYTTSAAKAARFKTAVPKIQFTDSGHGMVPAVTEVKHRGLPKITGLNTNEDHVREHMK